MGPLARILRAPPAAAPALLLCLSACAAAPRPADDPARFGEPRFLSPGDVIHRLSELGMPPIHLVVGTKGADLEKFATALWPAAVDPDADPPLVRASKGGPLLQPPRCTPEAQEAIDQGEKRFAVHDFAGASELYRDAIQKDARCGPAWSFLGDCAYQTERYEEAIRLFERATDLNPDDFLPVFFRADALARLGRYGQAREAYIRALVLRPRRASVLGNLKAQQRELGVTVRDQPLLPRAALGRDEHQLIVVAAAPDWIFYGLCKAVWQLDAAHRRTLTGEEQYRWTPIEEHECFSVLLSAHARMRSSHDGADPDLRALGAARANAEPDPALDRLEEIFRQGFGRAYVTYEIASRISPYASLVASDEERRALDRFVRRFVVVAEDSATGRRRR